MKRLAAACVLAGLFPSTAVAKDLYVRPAGCGATPDCYATIGAAVAASASGDTVHLAYNGGTPYAESTAVSGRSGLTIAGERAASGAPPMVITASPVFSSNAPDLTLRDLYLGGQGAARAAIESTADGLRVERVRIDSDGPCATAGGERLTLIEDEWRGNGGECAILTGGSTAVLGGLYTSFSGQPALRLRGAGGPALVQDALVEAGGSGTALVAEQPVTIARSTIRGGLGAAVVQAGGSTMADTVAETRLDAFQGQVPVAVAFSAPAPATLLVRNVTALARGGEGVGVLAATGGVTVLNTVARGGANDLGAATGANLSVRYSNFRTTSGPVDASGAGNQSGDPLFRNFIPGPFEDYRVMEGSPLIDAGEAVPAGTKDRDGVERPRGAGVDIGAYESAYTTATPTPTAVPTATATATPTPSATATATPGRAAPRLTLRFRPRCVRRRTVVLELRVLRGPRVVRARARARGRRRPSRLVGRKLTVARLPRRAFTLAVTATLADGRRVRATRRLRPCAHGSAQPG